MRSLRGNAGRIRYKNSLFAFCKYNIVAEKHYGYLGVSVTQRIGIKVLIIT